MAEEKFSYRMHAMDVLEFSIKEQLAIHIDLKKVKFNVTADTKLNPDLGLLGVFVTVMIFFDKIEESIAVLKTVIGFEVKDFQQVIKKNDAGEIILPFKLEAATRRIALSTTRGVLYCYLSPTYLKNAILPIVPELLMPEKKEKINP